MARSSRSPRDGRVAYHRPKRNEFIHIAIVMPAASHVSVRVKPAIDSGYAGTSPIVSIGLTSPWDLPPCLRIVSWGRPLPLTGSQVILGGVGGDPIIAQSAFKHGLNEEEILHAYRNPVRIWDLGDGFTMMIGPNQAAIFLEFGYVQGEQVHVIVYAMRAREKFLR